MKKYENELFKKGFKKIAGIDEVGRGCWAGPLVVAICMFDSNYVNEKIKDSKQINENVRNSLFNEIIKNAILVDWIIYDPNFVDLYNPKKVSIIGMEYLINKHVSKLDYCLIDAEKITSPIPCMSIIKGDSKSQSIAAASIVAKVIRDNIMKQLDKQYPKYHFGKHKGYGTYQHKLALTHYGPIKNVHRFSYKPIKNIVTINENK